MSYAYDAARMETHLGRMIKRRVTEKAAQWLDQQFQRWNEQQAMQSFNITFTAIPRFVNKTIVQTDAKERNELIEIRSGFSVNVWTLDRLARSWWLLHLPVKDKDIYLSQLENLFKAAEMNEQVALYGSLPLLAFPESLTLRTAEGIRTNMGLVFEAVALDNPYPAEYLDEAAWNQMVLKAFFMDKPVDRIMELDKRSNKRLAHILSDYAHERWSAGRAVNPLLWRPVGGYIDEAILPDIKRLFESGNDPEIKAAALAATASTFPPAKDLLNKYPELAKKAADGILTWDQVAEAANHSNGQ